MYSIAGTYWRFYLLVLICILFSSDFAVANPISKNLVPKSPKRVLFYPEEVFLEVEDTLPLQTLPDGSTGVSIVLPAHAERHSFFAIIEGKAATSFTWEEPDAPIMPVDGLTSTSGRGFFTRAADEPLADRRAILATIEQAEAEIRQQQAGAAMLNKRLELWQASINVENLRTEADRTKLDNELQLALPALYAQLDALMQNLKHAEAKLLRAQAELRRFDETFSFVQVHLTVPTKDVQLVQVNYGYFLPASFSSNYNIFAKPDDKLLDLEHLAVLEQSSGFTWENTEVSLSTIPRSTVLQPRGISPWWLSIVKEEPINKSAKYASEVMASPANAVSMDTASSVEHVPTFTEMSTFKVWNLGKKTIVSSVPNRVMLKAYSYETSFFYLVRPTNDARAFLVADVDFGEHLELPAGQARIFLDNMNIGEVNFTVAGKKMLLGFGSDPLVRANMQRMASVAGEQGVISKDQTQLWEWEILVQNGRSRKIDLRVEDAAPISMDKNLTVKVTSTPKAEQISPTDGEPWLLRWSMTLDAGEEKTIKHRVESVAPANVRLNHGRY